MKKVLAGIIFGGLTLVGFGLVAEDQPATPIVTESLTETAEAVQVSQGPAAVDGERISNADSEPGNWMAHGRTYGEQRYSPLTGITEDNVSELGLAWHWETGTKQGLEATPIVVDGVMYISVTWGEVFALNAKTGEMLWKGDFNVDRSRGKFACCDVINRGVAVWKGKVFVGTLDGRLVAVDAKTGKVVWEKLTIDLERPYTITGAPRIVKDKVVIGNGGAEFGVRGYITAYDTETGEQAWRFYTVPGNPADGFENSAMEMAAETWGGGEWWVIGGGGTAWDSMSYDPELNLLYIGVGNGSPWNKYIRSPAGGDNLFLSSIVALNPDTGEYVWHYQTTPGEAWDYTATQHMILAEIEIKGKERKVIMQAPKNGFFYVLDRETGEFISADNYVPVTWATHIDPETGRPVQTDNDYDDKMVYQFPSPLGGHNWQPMCYHQETGLVYIPSRELGFLYSNDENFEYKPGTWNVGLPVMKDMQLPTWIDPEMIKKVGPASTRGYLQAWDPVKQEQVWQHNYLGPWNGGLLCTSGNLVFQGNGRAELTAFSADKGEVLWQYDTQSGIIAPPITYTVDGEQYVAVLAGWGGSVGLSFSVVGNSPENPYTKGRVLAFKIGGKDALPEQTIVKRMPEPPEDVELDSAKIKEGNKTYHNYCVYCHGPGAISSPNLKDLRYMDAETHEQFTAIVLGGIMQHEGMPAYNEMLNAEDVENIHQYLIKVGRNALAHEQEASWWTSFKDFIYGIFASITKFFVGLGISIFRTA